MPGHSNDAGSEREPADTLSQAEIENLIRRLEEASSDLQQIDSEGKAFQERELRKLVGPHFDAMLQSKESTLRFLEDANPNLRSAAVHVAIEHWDLKATIIAKCDLALIDPDVGVRQTMIAALGSCCANTKDPRVGQVLARIVRDEGQPIEARLLAYASLVCLNGPSPDCLFERPVPSSVGDIDWMLVDQFGQPAES